LAAAVQLMERTNARIGGREYEARYGSIGITT
jgi:hypothetical protein